MAVCPKCGMEYVPGVVLCTDCKVALVEKQAEVAKRIAICKVNDALSGRIIAYLDYCNIKSAQRIFSEEENCWYIVVDEPEADDALKQAAILIEKEYKPEPEAQKFEALPEDVENEVDGALSKEQAPELIIPEAESTRGGAYIPKKEKYNDLKSSASSFTIVGIACLIVGCLMVFKVINLSMLADYSRIMMECLMFVMGALFTFVGINSAIKVKGMKGDVEKEESATDQLFKDFTEAYTTEALDAQIYRLQPDISSDLIPFQRLELIKRLLMRQHPELTDEVLIDEMCDRIYEAMYE